VQRQRIADMDLANVTGLMATLCSAVSFVPQAWKIVLTGDASAISTRMYVITVTGFALWLAYGWQLGAWPIVLANAICLALSSFILLLKLAGDGTRAAIARWLTGRGLFGQP
jgi:MtN3 and saliva related transmembrane protein